MSQINRIIIYRKEFHMIQLFTHSDLDGVACSILAKLAYDDSVNVTFCNYDDIDTSIVDFLRNIENPVDMIHITDISVSDAVAIVLDAKDQTTCRLFDHHPTAFHLTKYPWCTIMESSPLTNLKTSGTELYYLYLDHKGMLNKYDKQCLRRFVDMVTDWDTWRWSNKGKFGELSKKLNDLLYLYGRDNFISRCIDDIMLSKFPNFTSLDNTILDIEQRRINEYISLKNSQMTKQYVFGKYCGIVFADKYFSELGNSLCKLNPDIDFVTMIDIGNCSISYRTIKDDIHLGRDIAKPLGGGGHPKSAGSTFSKDIISEIIKLLVDC